MGEAALNEFDRFVRRELPRAFASAQGLSSFGYTHYLVMSFALEGVSFLDLFASIGAGLRPHVAIAQCGKSLLYFLVMNPMILAFAEQLSAKFWRQPAPLQWLYMPTLGLALSILYGASWMVVSLIIDFSGDLEVALASMKSIIELAGS